MNKWGKIIIATISTLALTACGSSATSDTASPSATSAAPTIPAPPTPDETFAQEAGLTGAELTQGIEWSQNMCAEIAKVVLAEGDAPGSINKGMLRWFETQGIDIFKFDKDTIVPLAIAGAKAYCQEYVNGVEIFFAE